MDSSVDVVCNTAEVGEISCLEVIGKGAIVDVFGDETGVSRGMMCEDFSTKELGMNSSIKVEVGEGNSSTEVAEVDVTTEVVELDTSVEMVVGMDASTVVGGEKVFVVVVGVDNTEVSATGSNPRLVTCVWFTEI